MLAFQTSLAGGQDAYVAKIKAAGSALVYTTYLAARGKSQAAPRADLFRQLYVAESAKYDRMTVVLRRRPGGAQS